MRRLKIAFEHFKPSLRHDLPLLERSLLAVPEVEFCVVLTQLEMVFVVVGDTFDPTALRALLTPDAQVLEALLSIPLELNARRIPM